MSIQTIFVGGGPEARHLRGLVAQSKLEKVVDFLGPVPRKQLGGLYRSADIVCVPSRSDPLPTVVLEAMVAGVAVVGTDVGGIAFMIEHEKTGIVCPLENSDALAIVLERFFIEENLILRMGEAGQRKVKKEFAWQKIGESLVKEIIMNINRL